MYMVLVTDGKDDIVERGGFFISKEAADTYALICVTPSMVTPLKFEKAYVVKILKEVTHGS